MAAWVDWLPASSIRWRPSTIRPLATAFTTSTACSVRKFRMVARLSVRTPGVNMATPGRSAARNRCRRSRSTATWKPCLVTRAVWRRCGTPVARSKGCPGISRWLASAATPSTSCVCGSPVLPSSSTGTCSTPVVTSTPRPRKPRPRPSPRCSIQTMIRMQARSCVWSSSTSSAPVPSRTSCAATSGCTAATLATLPPRLPFSSTIPTPPWRSPSWCGCW